MTIDAKQSGRLLSCLTAVYLIWGCSFMFTKLGATHLPPGLFSGVRFTLAGLLLGGFAYLFRDQRLPSSLQEWLDVSVMGFLTVLISNGLNVWSIKFMSSSESALLNSTAALWIAGLGVFGARGHPLTRRAMLGVVLGAVGTALTLIPRLVQTPNVIAYLGPLAAALAWSLATFYYRNRETRLGMFMFIGMQMLTGGVMQLGIGLLLGEASEWHMNLVGGVAMVYLTVFSSCMAYTAYGWLTLNSTPAIIGTYSYVNPALAAFVGWAFLSEHLLPLQLLGMAVILVGVLLVTLPGTSNAEAKTLQEPTSQ